MNNFVMMISGLTLTVELTVCALMVGLLLALIFTLLKSLNLFYLKFPIDALVFFIRGTPLLVQIFIIYYGSAQFHWLRESFLWIILKKPFGCATIALGLNTCAYTTVLLSGAIKSIPRGEIEACQVLGLSNWQMLHKVILPRAWRIALPAYSNEVIMVLKSTSLASTITLLDIMGVTHLLIARTYQVMPFFILAGCFYLSLNLLIVGGFKWVENRWHNLIR